MRSDIEIAESAKLEPIWEIAKKLDLDPEDIEPYGKYKGKIPLEVLKRLQDRPDGRLVLVTSINPTTAGEGKTTTVVGLGQALNRIGKRSIIALREPSLGPCMGLKGGAAGGGYSQVVPMEDINLHFTGDFHAITSAHNLLAAMLDNHLHQGNALGIDPRTITWPRVLDMNDRVLRHIVIGLGGKVNGVPREGQFMITVASEVMAILCLATDLEDLKARLGSVIVASTYDGSPVRARDLKAEGAMAALLKDAIKPNLVQTLENTPAIIHGGPFANIAHGNNSILATRLALKLADYVVTESGFGSDLGAEKFMDIVAPYAGFKPQAVVVVATIRALKLQGGASAKELGQEDLGALDRGMANLEQHVAIVRQFGLNPVVSINRFPTDSPAEIELLKGRSHALGVEIVLSDVFNKGGEGGVDLAEAVVRAAQQPGDYHPLYERSLSLPEKIEKVAREIYGADGVDFSPAALKSLSGFTDLGYGDLPVCMAKTQYSLSDDAKKLGRPTGFRVTVREARLSAGAGFVVAMLGDIMTMPGLPKVPAAEKIDLTPEGHIRGLF
ncbi:MAG: formate--tetrahydrofolate ligase [Thermaerobacter sp.]|nr:formate--tetrahydrofolate ligase [Thermaerobacter sp.]